MGRPAEIGKDYRCIIRIVWQLGNNEISSKEFKTTVRARGIGRIFEYIASDSEANQSLQRHRR